MAKFRNESSTSASTLFVVLGVAALAISVGRGVLAAAALPVEVSLAASFLVSCDCVSPEAIAAALFSVGLTAVLFCARGLASGRAI